MRLRSKQESSFFHKALVLTAWLAGVAALVGIVGWVFRRDELT